MSHQNPEKARIAKSEEYKWSSYHVYLSGAGANGYLPEMAGVFGIFAQNRDSAVVRFQQFHAAENDITCMDIDADDEFEVTTVQQIIADILKNTGLTLPDLTKTENVHLLKELILNVRNKTGYQAES